MGRKGWRPSCEKVGRCLHLLRFWLRGEIHVWSQDMHICMYLYLDTVGLLEKELGCAKQSRAKYLGIVGMELDSSDAVQVRQTQRWNTVQDSRAI